MNDTFAPRTYTAWKEAKNEGRTEGDRMFRAFACQLESELTTEYQRGLNDGLEQAAIICANNIDVQTDYDYPDGIDYATAIRAQIKK